MGHGKKKIGLVEIIPRMFQRLEAIRAQGSSVMERMSWLILIRAGDPGSCNTCLPFRGVAWPASSPYATLMLSLLRLEICDSFVSCLAISVEGRFHQLVSLGCSL